MFPAPMLDNTVAISNGGGISKFINKNSKNIDASKALLNFLAQSENLETYYAARTDLVSSAFKDVKSVSATTATKEMLERTTSEPPVMAMRDVNYWDPNIYKYMQGFASGKTSVDDFIKSIDDYRATMFDTAAASDSE
jgi:ABC-type glycerol-3-phosphate transport system substrate-binding protein